MKFSNKERRQLSKQFKSDNLQTLLNKNNTQTKKKLADALNVTQTTISKRLHTMRKI